MVVDQGLGIHRVCSDFAIPLNVADQTRSYVEQTLKDNAIFNAVELSARDGFKGRLKFWTNDMCAQRPQTFDIVLAVRAAKPP